MAKKKEAKPKTRLQLKAEAIATCRDADGRIRPMRVVEAAKNPKSILHKEFPWDIKVAAQKYWLSRAQELIREVQLEYVTEELRFNIPYYVRDPSSKESSYVPTISLVRKTAKAKQSLNDELDRIKGAIRRALKLAVVFDLESTFEKMLDDAILIEKHLGEDGAGDEASA